MENPIQFTMVREVPFDATGALCATRVENKGESAITTSPQKKRNASSKYKEFPINRSGEAIQHKPDSNKNIVAVFFTPKYCEA